ncbi:glycosyltransferase [Leptotrichia sp. OH3620_COT-345]|uniref:glycosyltransferase n=1 Tax=Leptotrichia sp. OH3620_COT-345 TaxID=2491048 RepID=UPI000F652149|nr:glycosyltransferase [Leptotrichia sp. OH3620_COT-345]RRD40773.1 glycosyltransferase [Leptotrichia sp. OH3620_COT-345]
MSTLELSIVIPVYNVEKYLEKCLSSLCGMEISNEIIIVNDGTQDSSLQIAQKFKENHKEENIKIISQINRGLSEARNTGLKAAVGKYISFIDSDDFVDTEAYSRFVSEVIKDDVDIGIGRYKKILEKRETGNENFQCVTEIRNYKRGKIRTGKEYLRIMYENDMHGPEVWDDLFKREFLIENNIFFKKGRMHEDEIFTVESLIKASKVKFYGIYYYNYLQREKSIMSTKSSKNYEDMEKNINEIYNLMLSEKDEKIKKVLEAEIHRLYKIIIKHTEHKYKKECLRFKENYTKFSSVYREDKIRKLIIRLKKSIKKKFKQ